MKNHILRTLLVLLVLLSYVISSLILPPMFHRKAETGTIAPGSTGERVVCVDDNVDALVWRIRMIESAKEEVILSTFGFGTGRAGTDMLSVLLNAAERGVKIRLLLDGYHGSKAVKKNENFEALLSLPNVELRLYNTINVLTPWTANYRMHDKYIIIDDNTYILGGRNTNDLFLGDYSATPNIDRDILVYSPAVSGSLQDLRNYFESVWALDECREFTFKERDTEAFRAKLRSHYEGLKKTYPTAFGFSDWEGETLAANSVTVLTGGINVGNKAPTLWKDLCAYMKQGEKVMIQTPYVICSKEMYDDLTAITGGGTQVTVLTNSTETGANPFGCTDYMLHKQNILDTGSSILEYAGEHSLHAKTILIDDSISIVGSFNMDMRSAYIDTETMLVIDCPALNDQLHDQVVDMAKQSLYITPEGKKTAGPNYSRGELGFWTNVGYISLSLVEWMFRHLL